MHAVKELQKALMEYNTLKERYHKFERKLVAVAQQRISIPAKRNRRKTERFQPIDLTKNDAGNLSDTDTEPVGALVPVKVEQEEQPKKKKKKQRVTMLA